ncbi:hypothetical protein NDU88_005752 [Pleurodeles waltl]|uniref:Uncharacterized protein n=1 Tax=Pleurodeles waltl TaxID=8319 RepID=A0AAV7NPW0_PLEWA|nr:hypothetical protein NDU88_005752 [Pleurodeles waltl]
MCRRLEGTGNLQRKTLLHEALPFNFQTVRRKHARVCRGSRGTDRGEDTTLASPPGDGEEGTKISEAKREGPQPLLPPPGAGKAGTSGSVKSGERRKEDPEAKDWSGHWSLAYPKRGIRWRRGEAWHSRGKQGDPPLEHPTDCKSGGTPKEPDELHGGREHPTKKIQLTIQHPLNVNGPQPEEMELCPGHNEVGKEIEGGGLGAKLAIDE